MVEAATSSNFQYSKLEHGLVFVMLCGMVIFLARIVRSFQQRGVQVFDEEEVSDDAALEEESEGDTELDNRHSD